MSEEEPQDVISQIVKTLTDTLDTLMVCSVEERSCKKCKERGVCLIYIRTIIASLCKIEIARFDMSIKNTPESMYV